MVTNELSIKIVDSPEEAPTYDNNVKPLKIVDALIVGKGTINNNPTVDLKLTDKNGKAYLVMATGGIIEMLAASIKGKRERDNL